MRRTAGRTWICALAASLGLAAVPEAGFGQTAPSVSQGPDGRLVYESTPAGDTVLDFSYAGYRGGGRPIPSAPVRVWVEPGPGDDRARIQAALDVVAAMPPDGEGRRGAVLLRRGAYQIESGLKLAASGVVLRGEGKDARGTVLVGTGTLRRALITIEGSGGRQDEEGSGATVAEDYAPVGARHLTLQPGSGFKPGDAVAVRRPSTDAWIELLGMNAFPGWRPENRLHWRPGSRDVVWERTVTAVEGDRITLDAPLTTALDARYGGGLVRRSTFPGRIREVGVENLRLVSQSDATRPLDEDHAWIAISLDKVEDAWVREVSARGFVSHVINAGPDSRRLTVQDVDAAEPVSELGGQRRRVFFTTGQQSLLQRCSSVSGRRDFAVGHAAAGPNVFLDCTAVDAHDFSGPVESWASGVLYDNVKVRGNALRLINRDQAGQGVGWAAANSVLWNCEATDLEIRNPPGAWNQAYGCKGTAVGEGVVLDPRAQPNRDFFRAQAVPPRSLYRAQLAERLGPEALKALERARIPTDLSGARAVTTAEIAALVAGERRRAEAPRPAPLRVEGGRFLVAGVPAYTRRQGWSWFQAQTPPSLAASFGPAITRFAPGRGGPGLTDDLAQVAAAMKPGEVFEQHYGLWYDRRRVNHNFDGSPDRRTGEVWAPFMELPWARSGQGRAWDGLSKYDLTRFNPWYFDRVKAFAEEADRRGVVLQYDVYFQHWLLESRSHYVDFPWRPVNTLQATDMPDEVPAAEAFWDVSHPERRRLHRLYIRKSLDTLKGATNVVFALDPEYTGPLSFVRFWLDTIAEWERESGRRVFINLDVPKDQLDAILADPVRGPRVTAAGFHHWIYRPDGALFAARGGINKAPREQLSDILSTADLDALRPKVVAPEFQGAVIAGSPEAQQLRQSLWAGSKAMRYRAWREYRDRHPALVLTRGSDEFPELSRNVETTAPKSLRARMRAVALAAGPPSSTWAIGDPGRGYLVYSMEASPRRSTSAPARPATR